MLQAMSDGELTERFQRLSVAQIADAVVRLELPSQIAPPGIRSLFPGTKIAGPACPVKLHGYDEGDAAFPGGRGNGGRHKRITVLPPSTVTQAARSSSTIGAVGSRLGTAHVIAPMLTNKDGGRHTNTSRKVSRRVASPACIAGVRVSRPNFRAPCGRTKL